VKERDRIVRMLRGERGINLERALQIRHFGRSRRDDESVIPFFETEEFLANPFLGEKQSLDRDKFLGLIDRFYELRGWDSQTGWPTQAKLLELGLDEVANQLYPEPESVGRRKRTVQR
jgi:aldehyde:ferredoxin oxidoreductase